MPGAGAAVTLQHLNAQLALGQPIDLSQHAQAVSAKVRVASRLGLQRRARDVLARHPSRSCLRAASSNGRTSAAKAFDRLVADIESDLGGSDRLSAIERALVEGCAGAVTLQHLNAQLALASLSLDGLRDAPPFAAKAPPCVPGADLPAGRRSCA